MTAVKDTCQPNTGLQRHNTGGMDQVVDDVARLLEIDRVDDFVVAVAFVAIEVLGLAAVSCYSNVSLGPPATSYLRKKRILDARRSAYRNNARKESHWAARPLPATASRAKYSLWWAAAPDSPGCRSG